MKSTVIWKFEVTNFIQMPHGFKILSAQWQRDQLVLWAAIDPGNKNVTVEVLQISTGSQFDAIDDYKFLGTFQRSDFAFHVFYRELQ